MITYNNMKVTFGHTQIGPLNLTFKEGKIYALIGPSGSGKTTTLKLLNRLVEADEGTIYIKNVDYHTLNVRELRKKFGYVIQSIGLFPHMTILENILLANKTITTSEIEMLLEQVGLTSDVLPMYPNKLSGGMQQRIGVVRALALETDYILLDEPFSALDPQTRETMQDVLRDLQKHLKKTMIIVTHDIEEACYVADEIIIMNQGKVVEQLTVEALLNGPTTEFGKEFIPPRKRELIQFIRSQGGRT